MGGLRIASGTGEVIRANVSDNTLKAYEHATRKLEAWLEGRALTDAVLAEYIRFLYAEGKSPATINLVVSAVKWMAEYRGVGNVVWDMSPPGHWLVSVEKVKNGSVVRLTGLHGTTWNGCARRRNRQIQRRAPVMRR